MSHVPRPIDTRTGAASQVYRRARAAGTVMVALAALLAPGCGGPSGETEKPRRLTHEETLQWVREHHAWRLARKTKPIWARPVRPDEVGREFQTADHATETARDGYWLCAGVAGEPWFQKAETIAAKYDRGAEEVKQFSFDEKPVGYTVYTPRGDVRNWAARVAGPGIEGFFVRPGYDRDHPLYSPAGGYVVRDHVADPYEGSPADVWLVQESLFEQTYEFVP
jgi:hypothetical protein